jgi:hypothetical protein
MTSEVLGCWASIEYFERLYADVEGSSHMSSKASSTETLTGSCPLQGSEKNETRVTEHSEDVTGVDSVHMRKRLITPTQENIRARSEGRLDVERAAVVEFTSEDQEYPIESVFGSPETRGWRAAAPVFKPFG